MRAFWSGILALLLLPVSGSLATSPKSDVQVVTAVTHDGHDYCVVFTNDGSWTWDEADEIAHKLKHRDRDDWHLVTLTSQAENEFAHKLVSGTAGLLDLHPSDFWLGGFQPWSKPSETLDEKAKQWRWVTAEDWDFTAWRGGENAEPNNSYAGGHDKFGATIAPGAPEECMHFVDETADWDDLPHEVHLRGFIAESDGPLSDEQHQSKANDEAK